MKNILEAEDIQGEAQRWFKEVHGEQAAWHLPWVPSEVVSKLLSGYTVEMVEEWLEVVYSLKPLPAAKPRRKR